MNLPINLYPSPLFILYGQISSLPACCSCSLASTLFLPFPDARSFCPLTFLYISLLFISVFRYPSISRLIFLVIFFLPYSCFLVIFVTAPSSSPHILFLIFTFFRPILLLISALLSGRFHMLSSSTSPFFDLLGLFLPAPFHFHCVFCLLYCY